MVLAHLIISSSRRILPEHDNRSGAKLEVLLSEGVGASEIAVEWQSNTLSRSGLSDADCFDSWKRKAEDRRAGRRASHG